jgi:hypothetical protein
MMAIRMEERGTIAVIEDPFVSKFLRDLLTRQGYRIVEAKAAHCADVLKGHVDLVITNAPDDLGDVPFDVPLLYLAATPDPALAARFSHCRAVEKPFQMRQLLNAVEELTQPLAG